MNDSQWRDKTNAKITTISQLKMTIQRADAIAVGLAGFSGSFENNVRPDAEFVTRSVLNTLLRQRSRECRPRPTFFVSGGTNSGVPRVGYEVANSLGCVCVGVTAEAAIRYSIAEIDYLAVVGKKFGQESEAFISLLDELWVVGGGEQSLRECKLASYSALPISMIQGIGGIADDVSCHDFAAKYIDIDRCLSDDGE